MTVAIERHANVTITCDGPRCSGLKGEGPTVISYDEEQVKNKPDGLPDEFYRLLTVQTNPGQPEPKVFCSTHCVKDFLNYVYVPPRSPREMSREMQENLAKVPPTAEAVTQVPVSQADGEAR